MRVEIIGYPPDKKLKGKGSIWRTLFYSEHTNGWGEIGMVPLVKTENLGNVIAHEMEAMRQAGWQ